MTSALSGGPKLDVYRYASVSSLLNDYVAGRKSGTGTFSFRLMARKLNLRSPSQLTMVARGEREPSTLLLLKLGEYFRLSEEEKGYLSAITGLRKAQTLPEKRHFAGAIGKHRLRCQDLILELAHLRFLSNWYMFAILSATDLANFDATPAIIAAQLGQGITAKQVSDAIELMQNLGLLARDDSGRLYRTTANIRTPANFPDAVIQNHHQSMCELAKEAVTSQAVDERYFSSTMVAIPHDKMELAGRLISEFRTRFVGEMTGGRMDRVYHLGVHFFKVME